MLKFITTLTVLIIMTLPTVAGQNFYVSPKGSDNNSGTKAKPFKTITAAKSAVRLINKKMTGDIHVYLRGGNYPVTNTIEFSPDDSGTNGHSIYYQAYEDEVPVLNGADRVTGWEKHDGNIYKANLNRSTKLRTLIVNGQRAYMANKKVQTIGGWGSYKITAGSADWARTNGSKPDGVKYRISDVPELKNADDVEIMSNTTWNSNIVCVREIITEGANRVLKLQQPYGAIALNQGWGAGFRIRGTHTICNVFEFLDEPGEFYFDRKNNTLYYYFRDKEVSKAEVYAPRIGCLLKIKGSSRTKRVENLTFKGITFANTEAELPQVAGSSGKASVQAATWCTAFDTSNWHKTKYRHYDTMLNAITVTSAKSITFENNTIKHIGNEGIGFINDVSDSSFVGNACYNIGGSAIQVGHPQHIYEGDGVAGSNEKYPPEEEGVCKNILVKNNVLYDMTTMYYGHAGITAYFVEKLNIENNHIQGTNYSAVSLGWGWNNFDEISAKGNPTKTCKNNTFNNNRVYDCMRMLHDGGAFYTLGSQPGSEASGNYVKAKTKHFQGVYHPDEGTAWYKGKDLVFEITPGQDNFELNNWKRKHDNHYSNVYSTSKKQAIGAPNCSITKLHVIPNADWPEEALAIIHGAGVEKEYHHLLKIIPDITFESRKRYDTTEKIVDSPTSPTAKYIPPTKEGRYEAEKAQLSIGATVDTEHPGFSGKGFVKGYYNKKSATTTFTVQANEMGTHNVLIRYAAGHKDCKNIGIYVNGEKSEMLSFKSTGKWNIWNSHTVSVSLKTGLNTISLKAETNSVNVINIDYIQVSR